VKRAATPKLGAYAGLAGLGLLAALVLGRPELVALAAPFAVIVAFGLILADEPGLSVRATLDKERMIEGDEVLLEVELHATRGSPHVELYLPLADGLTVVEGTNPTALRLARDETRTLELRIRAERWGGYVLGEALVRTRDVFGLFRFDVTFRELRQLRVFPHEEYLRHVLRPRDTQPYAGDEVARRRGEGIEFADIRPFVVGDPLKRVNWRATARRGELWVNDRHPERNTDVVIFLDTFAEARRGEASTLDLAVRAAATIARHYVARRDRVALVGFGGVLRWLLPGSGLPQLYRIVDALLDTEIRLNYAWKDIDIVPRRTLPPQALVVALTPLLDERSVGALLDLRARGFDLAVIETSPLAYLDPGTTRQEQLAWRIWELRREALRTRYRRAGVAVAEWRPGEPLAPAIEEVNEFRRYALASRS
jgi:uncharacterized protein (DUF58 family)